MSDTGSLVYVVDDDVSAREGLARLICSAGLTAKTFVSGEEFLATARPKQPGCLILDVNLPGLNGLDLQQELVESGIEVPIIFLTGCGDIRMTVRAVQAGAANFLTKPFDNEELLKAVRQALEQSRLAQAQGTEMKELRDRYVSLTPRERQIMGLVISGLLNKQVGGELGISEKTVKAHRSQVMRKMKANSLADLVRMAGKLHHSPATKESVRLDERTRIARELHDTLLQTFLSALIHLGAAVDAVPEESPMKPQLDQVLQVMSRGIEEGRSTIQGLRSSDSVISDLVIAFSSTEQELSCRPDIDFRVNVVGRRRPLNMPIQQEIYRIGREALLNAFCHSGAKRIGLELEYAERELQMRVRDDGIGISSQVLRDGREGHWGLAGMQERAARMGSLLKISSSPSKGTEVRLSIPSGIAFQRSTIKSRT